MKRPANLFARLAFLEQFGLLPWLGLSLAVTCIRAGDSPLEWILYASLGLATLVAGLWFAFRADPAKPLARLAYVLVDLATLGVSGLWAWLTRGTPWVFQFCWAIFSILLALVSLAFLLPPGASARLGGKGSGALRRIEEERLDDPDSRKRLLRRRLVCDLSTLVVVLALSVNAWFSMDGYGGSVVAPASSAPMRVSYWGFTWEPAKYGEAVLGKLSAAKSALYLFVSPAVIDEKPADFEAALREWGRRGIDVYLTVGIPSAAKYREDIVRIAEWVRARDLPAVKGFTADIEWPEASQKAYKAAEAKGDIIGQLRGLLSTSYGEAGRKAEEAEYSAAIARLRELGFETQLVGMFWELDDAPDGDKAIQRLMHFAAVPPAWDVYNYMIYRWDYATRESPYFTWFYLNEMSRRFPAGHLSTSLGVTGYHPLDSLDELVMDIRISRAFGAREAVIFILNPGSKDVFPNCYPEGLAAFDAIQAGLADGSEIRIPYTRSLFLENMQVRLLDMLLF